jgi:NTE family protein
LIGLVLSGGGARGAFQVGVWEVLRDHPHGLGRLPDVISGTSAGALNGALMAAGLSPREMLEFWLALGDDPPVRANRKFFRSLENAIVKLFVKEPIRSLTKRGRSARVLARVLGRHLRPGRGHGLAALMEYILTARFDTVSDLLDSVGTAHLFETAGVRRRLVEAIGGEYIAHPRCRLAINTVDVHTGQVVRFLTDTPRKHKEIDAKVYHTGRITVDMIMASAAIPLLFDPIKVGAQTLWDGGLLVNTPIAPAVALGASRIVPVLVTAERDQYRGPLTLGRAVERLADAFLENAYSADRKLLLERNTLAEWLPERGLRVVHLYECIRPASSRLFNAGSYLYFERGALTRMYEAGKTAARKWLARGPVLDTHPGPEPRPAVRVPL